VTFSIVGLDRERGQLGVAVATAHWAVGARVPYVQPRLAAIAVQAYAHPPLGYGTLEEMAATVRSGPEALQSMLERDPGRDWRQVGLIDWQGGQFAHTGSRTAPWSGHLLGQDCVAAGNMLTGEETVRAMIDAFARHNDQDLPDRLTMALLAGHEAGGDRRGQQSAALYVVATEPAPYVDLRVDDHPTAVYELVRLVEATRGDKLARGFHFATSRESPPVSEYEAHHELLRQRGLAP
jgi:uncharacterized Ntn-hydrolase superfamily protein